MQIRRRSLRLEEEGSTRLSWIIRSSSFSFAHLRSAHASMTTIKKHLFVTQAQVSLSKPLPVFNGGNEGFNHLGVLKVSVKGA